MSLNLNVNLSSPDQSQTSSTNTGATQSASGVGQTGWSGESQVVSLGGQLNITFDYTNPASTPQLPPPQEGVTDQSKQNDGGKQGSTKGGDNANTEVINYYENLATQLNQVISSPPLTQYQTAQVVHAIMTGETPSNPDPAVTQAIQKMQSYITQTNANITDGSPLSNALQNVQNTYTKSLTDDFGSAIEKQLQQLGQPPPAGQGLTQTQIANIRFAIYNPSQVTDPNIKAMATSVQLAAAKTIAAQYGLTPSSNLPVNTAKFNAQLSMSYYKALGTAIDQKLASLGITGDRATTLKNQILFKYSYPNSTVNDQVSNLTSQITGKLNTTFNAANGIPAGFNLPVARGFELKLNGAFTVGFQNNLQKWSPPLDSNTQQAVIDALQDPSNPNIPANIKSLISQIFDKTLSDVKTQYDIPDPSWNPDASTIATLGKPLSPQIQKSLDLFNQASEIQNEMLNVVTSMPPGPQQQVYFNILKEVSMALATLKEQIAEAEGAENQLSMQLNDEETKENDLKIKNQQDEMDAQQKKEAKMKPLQEFMKILGPMKYVMMALMAILGGALMGPAGVVMALAVCALMIADDVMGDKGPIKQMFNAIATIGNPGAGVVKFLVSLVFAIAAGPMLGVQFLFQNANVLGDLLVACGVDPSVASIANMVVGMVVNIVAMVLVTILSGGAGMMFLISNAVSECCELLGAAGQAIMTVVKVVQQVFDAIGDALDSLGEILGIAGKASEEAAEEVAEELPSILQDFVDSMKDIAAQFSDMADGIAEGDESAIAEFKDCNFLKYGMAINDAAQAFTGIAGGAVSVELNTLKAQLAKLMGDIDAMVEMLTSIVKNLQKIVQLLMQAVTGQGDWYQQLGQVQSNFWSDNTKVLGDVTTATRQ